ncbi:acyl-CoA carboxylase subunit epsilon [Streptomyces altiplanensis]
MSSDEHSMEQIRQVVQVVKDGPDRVGPAAAPAVLLARSPAVPGVPGGPRTAPARWDRPERVRGARAVSGRRSVAP